MTNEVLNILLFSNFFQKMCNFLRKSQKTVTGAQIPFEGKESSGDEGEYNLFFFMGNEVLNIYSYNNVFEKSNIFGENGEKNFERA